MPAGVVAFAFGTPDTLPVNKYIGLTAASLGLPIFSQIEVPLTGVRDVTLIEGKELPTLRIARGAIAWANKRNISSLHVFCAPPHAWRCLRDLREAAREAGVSKYFYRPIILREEGWFDKDSDQPRTRSWLAWNARELILRHMPYGLYARIAA